MSGSDRAFRSVSEDGDRVALVSWAGAGSPSWARCLPALPSSRCRLGRPFVGEHQGLGVEDGRDDRRDRVLEPVPVGLRYSARPRRHAQSRYRSLECPARRVAGGPQGWPAPSSPLGIEATLLASVGAPAPRPTHAGTASGPRRAAPRCRCRDPAITMPPAAAEIALAPEERRAQLRHRPDRRYRSINVGSADILGVVDLVDQHAHEAARRKSGASSTSSTRARNPRPGPSHGNAARGERRPGDRAMPEAGITEPIAELPAPLRHRRCSCPTSRVRRVRRPAAGIPRVVRRPSTQDTRSAWRSRQPTTRLTALRAATSRVTEGASAARSWAAHRPGGTGRPPARNALRTRAPSGRCSALGDRWSTCRMRRPVESCRRNRQSVERMSLSAGTTSSARRTRLAMSGHVGRSVRWLTMRRRPSSLACRRTA